MKKTMKDIALFSTTSVGVGALSTLDKTGGVGAVGSMMPTMGNVVMAGNVMRMSGGMLKALPKMPKKRR